MASPLPDLARDYKPYGVTVGTSATNLLPSDPFATRRRVVRVRNASANVIYLGKADVTTGTGWPLDPGEDWPVPLWENVPLYAIAASAGNDVRVWEEVY